MKKSVKIMVISGILVIGMMVFHKPLTLKAMDLVDYYGEKTGKNVVEMIDFLNEVYYL